MPLSEVLKMPHEWLTFLGERMEVLKAEETLENLTVSTFPHMKSDARERLHSGLTAIVERGRTSVSGPETEFDRAGLEALREQFRSRTRKG